MKSRSSQTSLGYENGVVTLNATLHPLLVQEISNLTQIDRVSVFQTIQDAERILRNSQLDLNRRLQLAERELARNVSFEKPWRLIAEQLLGVSMGAGGVQRRLGFLQTTLGTVLDVIAPKAA